jgi:hypothetical protein
MRSISFRSEYRTTHLATKWRHDCLTDLVLALYWEGGKMSLQHRKSCQSSYLDLFHWVWLLNVAPDTYDTHITALLKVLPEYKATNIISVPVCQIMYIHLLST